MWWYRNVRREHDKNVQIIHKSFFRWWSINVKGHFGIFLSCLECITVIFSMWNLCVPFILSGSVIHKIRGNHMKYSQLKYRSRGVLYKLIFGRCNVKMYYLVTVFIEILLKKWVIEHLILVFQITTKEPIVFIINKYTARRSPNTFVS